MTMRTTVAEFTLKVCCGIFVLLGGFLFITAMMFRADSNEELKLIRKIDAAIGVLFAVAYLLARIICDSGQTIRAWHRRTALGIALVWAVTSGPLMLIHTAVARARFAPPRKALTLSRMAMVRHALTQYEGDCGAMPPDERGLNALCVNPDIKGWAGPYVEPDMLADGWGRAFRVAKQDGHFVIWSCGPDGLEGTADDMAIELKD